MALTNDTPAEKIVCESCENEDVAQTRCNECGLFLCQYCTEFHKRSKSMKFHKLLTMEELTSSEGPVNIAEKMKCPKHKEEVIKLFCKTCQTTICRDCTIVDHRPHEYGFVEEVAVEEKQVLERNLHEVRERRAKVIEGITNLKTFNDVLDAKKKSTISEINAHFDELAKAVEARKNQMVEKMTSLTNMKQKQINAQIDVLEVALVSCESSIDFTEQAFKNGNDVQILSMEKYILQSLEQLKTVKDQTEPCVTEEVMFIIPSSVEETNEVLLNEYDVDTPLVSPGYCTASFNEVQALKAGEVSTISLICHDKNKRRLRYGGHGIEPVFTGMEVSDVSVTDNKDGSYVISFCPRQNGTLKVEISINGIPAPNCSSTKQVKWVISDVYGKGVVTDGGKIMRGEGEYCCRVGGCFFQSGIHKWKVQMNGKSRELWDRPEVGVIDCNDINADIANSKKKWVYSACVGAEKVDILLMLDMTKKMLHIEAKDYYGVFGRKSYQITARRVSPFFACRSSDTTLSIVE